MALPSPEAGLDTAIVHLGARGRNLTARFFVVSRALWRGGNGCMVDPIVVAPLNPKPVPAAVTVMIQ